MRKAQKRNLELKASFHDDFDATIIKSWFGFEEENLTGAEPSLIFTLEEKDGNILQVAFNTGIGWQIVEDGHRVEHSGFRKNFVSNSIIGCLIIRVIKGLGMRMAERGHPLESDIWIGLKFHWKMEEIDLVKALPDGKAGKIVHLMPTKYLGEYEFSTTTPEEDWIQLFKTYNIDIPSKLLQKIKDSK